MGRRVHWWVVVAIGVVAVGAGAAPVAEAEEVVGPYADPWFADDCEVHHFDDGEAPALGELDDVPLCVSYDKEDITVDNGGAVAFLLAEPARFAAAAGVCAYWQQDRWSVQLSRHLPALVSWEGSYWFDLARGEGAAVLRRFQIAGIPIDADRAADLVEPFSPELADVIRTYGGGPEGSAGAKLDLGVTNPACDLLP